MQDPSVQKLQLTVENDNCANPNGQFTVNVKDASGDEQPTGNYAYEWYEGTDLSTGAVISTGHQANGLKSGTTYSVISDRKCNRLPNHRIGRSTR